MYPTHTKLIRIKCRSTGIVKVQPFDVVTYIDHAENGFFYAKVLKSKDHTIIDHIYIVNLSDFAPLQPAKRIHHDAKL